MVRITTVLARVPVIKFRKGGVGRPAGGPAPTPASAPAASSVQQPAAAAMSTSSIPDIELPLRYQRRPLSQEEIDVINGGGIENPPPCATKNIPTAMAVIKIPKGILFESGKKHKEAISLNIVLHRMNQK